MDNNTPQTIYIEARPGTGGEEAKIWASELLRMYARFCGRRGWKVSQIDDGTLKVTGLGAYSALQNEAGVHRVQRIPATERRGRIHTSTATVAVIPQITQTQIQINPNDLEWQFFHASGHGGQNVQKVSSAVRLTHKPTGIVVAAQTERFQEQNRQIALEFLRAKLYQKQEGERKAQIQGFRASIGTGNRSEKIRTYNFPQDRITDHRVGKSWRNLEAIMNGELEKITQATLALG